MSDPVPDYVQAVLDELHRVRFDTIARSVQPLPPDNVPIVVCVVRDEIVLLHDFLRHYRSLGVERFCFIDNGSTDGTVAFLAAQPDVDLYGRAGPFNWMLKQGWINKAIDLYGRHRWFVCADADEQIVFDGAPERSLADLADAMDRRGITRVRGLLVDMYAEGPILQSVYSPWERLAARFPFFDRDTYREATYTQVVSVKGGPRRRLFGQDDPAFDPELTKYPLFRLADGEFMVNPHHIWPYEKNLLSGRHLAIQHFKFLPNFAAKIARAIAEKSYWNDSSEYRKYSQVLETSPDASFMGPETLRCAGPADFLAAGVIEPVGWDAPGLPHRMRARFRARRADLRSHPPAVRDLAILDHASSRIPGR